MKKIVAACQDAGPANNIGPVVKILRQRGAEVLLLARGSALDALKRQEVEFTESSNPFWALDRLTGPIDLAYLAVDSSQEPIGYEVATLLDLMGLEAPTYLQEDFWGAGLAQRELWQQLPCVPDLFFVNDPRGVALAQETFPEMRTENILPLGWPYLDAYARSDDEITALGTATLKDLGLIGDEEEGRAQERPPVIFFSGQLERTGETLSELVEAIMANGKPVSLITRMHPRMSQRYAEEAARCQAAIEKFKAWGNGVHLDCTGPAYSIQGLIAGATTVASMFSTTLVEAAAWRKPCVAILYPEIGQAEWLSVTGEGMMPDFPLCELGACAKAGNRDELTALIAATTDGTLEAQLRPNQEQHISTIGGNAERVATEIMLKLRDAS